MKKTVRGMAWIMVMAFLISMVPVRHSHAEGKTTGSVMPFRVLTAEELIKEMGAGWNLGNTMDGHTGFTPNETVWQNVKTTKELIKSVHDLGFNTIRIPVTWGTKIDDNNNYEIDEAWISRVQDIVDYCISLDVYAIINIHHDGAEQSGWLRIASEDQDLLKKKYAGVWENIAKRFKDYDEHLIFESMNEVKGVDMTVAEENAVICSLNQIFVDTVRAIGSNNEQRWLVVTGKYNYINSLVNEKHEFELPKDTVENRIIVSVHDYSPWDFCGAENQIRTEATQTMLLTNQNELKPMYEKYTSQGIPVIVGEYGCINKGNEQDRAYYLESMNRIFSQYNLIGIYWDQGWYDSTQSPDYSFTIIDRLTGDPVDKTITDAMMRGFFVEGAKDLSDITKNTDIISFDKVAIKETQMELTVGAEQTLTVITEPETANDVLLYQSSDETVAAVAYGKIRAKGVGTATITAFAQSGKAQASITVTVTDAKSNIPCTQLTLDSKSYNLALGEYKYLESAMSPADTDEYVYYKSSDESVATVSPIGKLLGVGSGTATITVRTSGGIQEEIEVTVGKEQSATEIQLALNVYYNDGINNYYSNEVGKEMITVTGDGQYTLTFDCTTDLSDGAKAAGVDSLDQLTAIYIKDYAVTQGLAERSPLISCDIAYNSIIVDGTSLTITNTKTKSALKDSGILDTNDPINFWDGSVVEEVAHGGFTTVEKPKKIEVTFTLSNVMFEGQEVSTDISQQDSEIETQEISKEVTKAPKLEETEVSNLEETDKNNSKGIYIVIIGAFIIIATAVTLYILRRRNKNNSNQS